MSSAASSMLNIHPHTLTPRQPAPCARHDKPSRRHLVSALPAVSELLSVVVATVADLQPLQLAASSVAEAAQPQQLVAAASMGEAAQPLQLVAAAAAEEAGGISAVLPWLVVGAATAASCYYMVLSFGEAKTAIERREDAEKQKKQEEEDKEAARLKKIKDMFERL